MKKQLEILCETVPLFLDKGFRKVNMDDIASHNKISKKTLYKYFENKQDIVHQSIQLYLDDDKIFTSYLTEHIKDPIEQLIYVTRYVQKMYSEINPDAVAQLQEYYSDSWELLNKHHSNHTYKMININIETGKDLGLFREDIDIELISKLYVAQCLAINQDLNLLGRNDKLDVIKQSFEYHIRGIATTKGIKRMLELEHSILPKEIEEITNLKLQW